MNKKLIIFSVGYTLAILIMYLIPILIIYPNIVSTIGINNEQSKTNSEYSIAVEKIQNANLSGELNVFKDTITSSLKSQVNIRNYIILFYAVMLFIALFVIALFCIKKGNMLKYIGKGIMCGNFVGAAGFTATVIFSSSYFIL
ncbi:MAG: hypothetical protein K0R72_721 [Clostridia bacterium]|jgi:beta-lactamase regulating signal transducer with metallopeptidase domain|nr:hypothetical protein [Clostridia bacterium]